MENNKNSRGLALFCTRNGIIKEVLKDDFGFGDILKPGSLFSTSVDKDSRIKSLDFINEIQLKNISFDFQLNFLLNESLFTLTFIGLLLEDQILLIASDNQQDTIMLVEQLQQITNEQANSIRQMLKSKHQESQVNQVPDLNLYDELSRLNNELVNLQRELRKKNAELERLNELKNRFLGMAAHDLRNPLNAIENFAGFILDEADEKLGEEHKKFLNIILSSSSYMLSMIENLLDISKIESGKIEINREKFDLKKLIEKTIQLNSAIAKRKNISLNFETDVNTLQISADKNKIEQVLNNLLSNAIKFSYKDSVVHVDLKQTHGKNVISVTDSGIGIEEEHISRLFVPFQKLTARGTDGEKCTGLGLSIVKKIVEGHSGKIQVNSEFEKGSTFSVELPSGI